MSGIITLLLSNLMPVLGTLITAGLGYLLTIIKARQAAATAQSKAEVATLKLAAIATALLQKAWTDIGPKVQAALADGKMDAAERAEVEAAVAALLKQVTDDATLQEIADALGLPLPGIIAKVASYLIDIWTKSHDPVVTTQSRLAFPVQAPSAVDYGPDAGGPQ